MVRAVGGELIVVTPEPWGNAPHGVSSVSFPSLGRGDRFDAASEVARGELFAFVDGRATLTRDWLDRVVTLFHRDPDLVVAGGPVVPVGQKRSQRVGALVMKHCLRGTPTAHNSRVRVARPVREVGVSNMIVRADAFRAVGGFQSPARAHQESTRLCYKVRTILGGKIVTDPSIALSAPAPDFPTPLLRDVWLFGRSRGDIARRLPMAVPLLPFLLPSIVAAAVAACLVVEVTGPTLGRELALVGLATVLLASVLLEFADTGNRGASLVDRLLAAIVTPVVVCAYGIAFVRGYLGRSLEDISPPRERKAPTRVLIFNWRDVTNPSAGGAEAYMHQIARRWAADGMDVGWITQRYPGGKRVEVIDRVRIHRVGGPVTRYPFAAVAYLLRLRRRYDILVDCENGVPFFTPLYSRKPKLMLVHHVHQQMFRTELPKQVSWLALWIEGWLMPRVYRRVPVVAVSQGTKGDLVELGFAPERISIVTNGVVPPENAVSCPSPRPTILCMGRLKPYKSVDHLIRALPALVERYPDVHLDVVGQGPDRFRLERLAWSTGMAGHVRFHGFVASSVRDRLASEAWVSVCASSFEGWGLVCMEASARGLPVVASDVPGLRESVRDGETGLLFPYGDVDALSECLSKLFEDADLRREMGEAGIGWAARHTWDGSAETFASLLTAELQDRPVVADSREKITPLASWV
jgi:glycosyltransferase involved in cell wall biosynthesis